MAIIVQKYGGSSVADVHKLMQVAGRVMRTRKGELYDTKAMLPEEREKAIFTAPKDAERVVVEPDDDDTIGGES